MENPFSVEGKTILVTGASSGIGESVARSLAELGAQVILSGRNLPKLESICNNLPGIHSIIQADLLDEGALISISEQIPVLDGIVFCAGIVDYTPVRFLSEEKIRDLFDVNFTSQVLLCKHILKANKVKKNGGSLVFISSVSSLLGVPATLAYAASKAALVAAVRVLASELAVRKIRVNAISPGVVKTPMTQQAMEQVGDESYLEGEKKYPLGYGMPEDVANACIYLVSDAGKWITGTNLLLDGGLTLQ